MRRSEIKYARIRISSSDGSWIDADEAVFLGAEDLIARTVFFLGAGFFALDLDPAPPVFASVAVLAAISRAAGSGPWPFACLSVSILDFLGTFLLSPTESQIY